MVSQVPKCRPLKSGAKVGHVEALYNILKVMYNNQQPQQDFWFKNRIVFWQAGIVPPSPETMGDWRQSWNRFALCCDAFFVTSVCRFFRDLIQLGSASALLQPAWLSQLCRISHVFSIFLMTSWEFKHALTWNFNKLKLSWSRFHPVTCKAQVQMGMVKVRKDWAVSGL